MESIPNKEDTAGEADAPQKQEQQVPQKEEKEVSFGVGTIDNENMGKKKEEETSAQEKAPG